MAASKKGAWFRGVLLLVRAALPIPPFGFSWHPLPLSHENANITG